VSPHLLSLQQKNLLISQEVFLFGLFKNYLLVKPLASNSLCSKTLSASMLAISGGYLYSDKIYGGLTAD